MKTVTLWNVTLEVAELAVKTMREEASKMLTEGANIKDVEKLLYSIDNIEADIRAVKSEDEDNA